MRVIEDDILHWKKASESSNCTIYKKYEEGSPIVIIKIFAIAKGISKSQIIEALIDTKYRSEWDTVLNDFKSIEDIPEENVFYRYFLIKLPIGIADRDFLHWFKIIDEFPSKGQTLIL